MLAENNYVQIQWVKAHAVHTGNERADKCAKEGVIAYIECGVDDVPLISNTLIRTELREKIIQYSETPI